MKKSIFIILPLILWAFAACDNDDSEWDSGNLGVNSVEGTWQRVGAYPKVLAIFGSDYTSTIQTFDVDDNLVTDYPQGKYRVAGDSLLVYERGFINRFEFDNDELVITYGYNARYKRLTDIPGWNRQSLKSPEYRKIRRSPQRIFLPR